ncbi:glycosyltransferase family 2 protein [Lacticaseibacillus daqingensis]|uniref:glycosyltransferase family 2 protein n=1 Tax=Lacticaseibacillus daqingensis TaxID=2486014 RepID=UPI000F7AF794|nr:glycosyltransferase [Lacticaseibacillus daqingensis]
MTNEFKTLAIIIPFHNETPAQVMRLLSSINGQIDVPFDQIDIQLIGDGVSAWPLDQYALLTNLTVRFFGYPEGRGAGFARQQGMMHTTSQYVMFMDADDELQDALALHAFFQVAETSGSHELIIARYTQQSWYRTGYRYYPSHPRDWKSPVAKWFNRAYLARIGLTWHPQLRIFEDTYFVGLACAMATDIVYLDRSVYLWLWNPQSTVRKDNFAFDHQLAEWVRAHRYALRYLRQRAPALYRREFYDYLADLYFFEQQHTPADPAAYAAQERLLLAENRGMMNDPQTAPTIAALAHRKATPGEQYAGMAMTGFDAFWANQEALLYQAFLAAQQAAREAAAHADPA